MSKYEQLDVLSIE